MSRMAIRRDQSSWEHGVAVDRRELTRQAPLIHIRERSPLADGPQHSTTGTASALSS